MLGTGTAFIRAENDNIIHLGGTGLGGGTFFNLSKNLLKYNNFEEIKEGLQQGNLSKVDLKMKDVTRKQISNLSSEITLANFGKIEVDASKCDLLIGLYNSIFEVVGVMGAFLCKNDFIKDIIIVGNLTTFSQINEILENVQSLHNIKFHLPENREFATALGATLVE